MEADAETTDKDAEFVSDVDLIDGTGDDIVLFDGVVDGTAFVNEVGCDEFFSNVSVGEAIFDVEADGDVDFVMETDRDVDDDGNEFDSLSLSSSYTRLRRLLWVLVGVFCVLVV